MTSGSLDSLPNRKYWFSAVALSSSLCFLHFVERKKIEAALAECLIEHILLNRFESVFVYIYQGMLVNGTTVEL